MSLWTGGVVLSALALYLMLGSTWVWANAAHSAWFGVRAPADRGLAFQYGATAVAPFVIAVLAWFVSGRWSGEWVVKWAWALGAGGAVGWVVLVPTMIF